MAEISDDELRVLRGAKALLDKTLSNPKTKRQQERVIKDNYPDTTITDDITDPVMEELKATRKEFQDYIKGQQDHALDSQLDRDIAKLKTERSFTDDGIKKLKERMIEVGNPNIIEAADAWEFRNKPQDVPPSIMAPTDWGFGRKTEDADLKLLFEDEDAWAEKEAARAWADESKKRGQIIT